MNELLPYANLGETISVSLDFQGIDKTDLGEHSFLVHAPEDSGPVTAKIDAQLPDGFEAAFPPSEQKDPPLIVLSAVTSVDGLFRTHVPLKKAKKNLYGGVIQIDPAIVLEAAKVRVYAVRAKPGGRAAGFTAQRGARLAWSPTQEIRLTEKPPPKGKNLEIKWIHFDEANFIPAALRDTFYFLEMGADKPVLYLNEGASPSLVKLVDIKGAGHPKAILRDTIFRSIAVSVWTALVRSAIDALRKEELFPVNFNDVFAGTLNGTVLKWIAPKVLPTMLPDDALSELCRSMNQDDSYNDILARSQLAIQSAHNILDIYGKSAEGAFANG
jgi:hypothetical protein